MVPGQLWTCNKRVLSYSERCLLCKHFKARINEPFVAETELDVLSFCTRLRLMKIKIIATIVAALAVVSICVADSVGTLRKSDATTHYTAEEVHAEVQKTQAELQQALSRIARLEIQLSSLQQANAKLEKAIQGLGQPRLTPLEH
jgi:septal ring factor EnvC (AmiA/AmiB activator)